MKKRVFTLILAVLMLLPIFTACNAPSSDATETTASGIAKPKEGEEKIMRVLVLGNSHSNDVFYQLGRVFEAQGYEDGEIYLGFLYYSGCSISKHVEFGTTDAPVYELSLPKNGWWEKLTSVTLAVALQAQEWDVILFQAAKTDLAIPELNIDGRRQLEEFVHSKVRTPHKIYWHTTWPSPNDESFFDPTNEFLVNYRNNLTALYGFNPLTQFGVNVDLAKEYILTDPNYEGAICAGKGIMVATQELGVPQKEIYRDYTHLSDYGRLIAAYTFYAQFTGKSIDEVKVDMIPAKQREDSFRHLGDFIVTEEVKEVIKESANRALTDPWTVPTPAQ